MRETNCIIRWIEVYPVDSIIQQLGPVFVYDLADFSLIVGSQCVGSVLLLFFGGGREAGEGWRGRDDDQLECLRRTDPVLLTYFQQVCGHKWADLSEHDWGVALITDCKYGYSTHTNVMYISL